ncbi:flagellar protein FlgN [Priestia aryabhattai]|uniref:Flagellar protein FlgN n=1 Tax=Priestia megaterium TaxID=1404 RepID=A0AA86I8P5_PRIMG|nr:flagellar protein FlgN [Priestia megaterium]MBY0025828.1 flagellar protein FlgN [Priestia aryabhattai]
MNVREIQTILEKQVMLHKRLSVIVKEKTNFIIKQDVKALTASLQKEQSHIAAISALETKRIESMEKSGNAARSIEEIAGSFSEYSILIPFQKQLIDIIQDIKYANDLNNQLLTQSLQLIHTELDLFVPSRREDSFNYTKSNHLPLQSNSIFNSKA